METDCLNLFLKSIHYETPLYEAYVRKHNHLPGIPSAGEVARDGLSVGDNQAALTRKIEELTLYTIELEKMLAAQNNMLELLQQQVNKLEKRSNQNNSSIHLRKTTFD